MGVNNISDGLRSKKFDNAGLKHFKASDQKGFSIFFAILIISIVPVL